jgi:phenylacetate-CoA ligase
VVSSAMADRVFTVKSGLAQPRTRRAARRMLTLERVAPELLRHEQAVRAMAVARQAFLTTPFYRELYTQAGFGLADLADPDNFAELPQVTKDAVREHGSDMVDPTRRRHGLRSTTGGSTGRPMQVLHDRSAPVAAMWWRAYRWWGVGAGEHAAFVTRQHRAGWRAHAYAAQWWPTRHLHLDARGMGPEEMEAFVRRWNRVEPQVLTGYVEAVHELAGFVARRGLRLRPPRAIAVTASVLRDTQRALVENALGAPVYDCYRSAEVPWIAAQCRERAGLHVMADLRVVETVDSRGRPAADGELGDVLLTDLVNSVQFLIRYRIGDRAHLLTEPCPCGMSLPTMSPVDGREVDVIRAPDGRVVPGGLSTVFSGWPGRVDHFQIEQHADYRITVRCVPTVSPEHATPAAEAVAHDIGAMLGHSVAVTVEFVSVIGHEGGKAKLVVSHVQD